MLHDAIVKWKHFTGTGPLCGVFTGHRLISRTKASGAELWCFFYMRVNKRLSKLECGTWYHHPRRLQYVLSRNMRIFKVATWHYGCRHNLKNDCVWDNLRHCLLGPRSPSKPVMLTFDLQKVLFIEIVFWHVKPRKTIMILAFIDETLPLKFAPGDNLS